MKKILAVLAALLVTTVGLVGCNNNSPSASGSAGGTVAVTSEQKSGYGDKSIDDLEEFLKSNGYINIEDDRSNVTEVDASKLGAIAGRRYQSTINNAVINVEIYEYDANALDETAKKVKSSISTSGQFQLDDGEPTIAYLNGSGQFLMIYEDTSNPEEGTENDARKKNAISAFKSFN